MNYLIATTEELASHFLECTSAAITQQILYYTRKEDFATVEKIRQARVLSKIMKLQEKLEK